MPGNSDTIRWQWPGTIAAGAMFLSWVAVMLLASEFGGWRIWGINHLAFTNPSIQPYFLGAAALGLVFILVPAGMRLKIPMPGGWTTGLTLAIAIGIIGWLLRSQAPLLGDGMMRAADAQFDQTPLPSEMAASYLSYALVRYLPAAWNVDGQTALQLISVASGVVLALGLWWFAPRTNERGSRTVIFWILTLGTVRLFAGYVESYAPAVMAVMLWTVAAVAYRRGRCSAFPLVVFWALASLSHATAIMLVPATAWLLFRGRDDGHPDRAALIAYGMVALALSTFIILRIQALQVEDAGLGTSHFLLPLTAGPPGFYGVLSPAHLIDFLNQWLLMAPAFLVALPFIHRWKTGKNRAWEAGKVSVHRRSGTVFWLLGAALPIVGGFFLDPKLGWARDWDLFALLFTPAAVGMALALARIEAGPVRRMAGAVAILSAGLWLSFSPDADAEQERFEVLLTLDHSRAAYGHETLARFHRQMDRPLGEIDQYMKALDISENLRYRLSIAGAYMRMDRNKDAVIWYRSILERDSTYDKALQNIALALERTGQTDEALHFAMRALANAPAEPTRLFGVGYLLMKTGEHKAAIPYLEAASGTAPEDAQCLDFLAQCYHRTQREADARTTWQQAIQVDPDYTQPLLSAATLELSAGHAVEAREWLAEYERRVPKTERSREARVLADSLARYRMPD